MGQGQRKDVSKNEECRHRHREREEGKTEEKKQRQRSLGSISCKILTTVFNLLGFHLFKVEAIMYLTGPLLYLMGPLLELNNIMQVNMYV